MIAPKIREQRIIDLDGDAEEPVACTQQLRGIIEIEVCERLGGRLSPILFHKTGTYALERVPTYQAQVKGTSAWAAGDTPDDAIGNLVRCHPEKFGIAIIHLEGAHAR